jgi:hypothetical protein
MQHRAQQVKSEKSFERPRSSKRPLLIVTAVIVVLGALLSAGYWFYINHARTSQQAQTTATNGASRWVNDHQSTPATYTFTAPTSQIPVDSAISGYYLSHAGAATLGAPLTPAFPVAQGWIQFFAGGALLLPAQPASTTKSTTPSDQATDALLAQGTLDTQTGVYRLPLVFTLLTLGSNATIGDSLTYVDLRSATDPTKMFTQPAKTDADDTAQATETQPVFVPAGTRDGQKVGHVVPASLWNYLNRADVSPDGWQDDWGLPLTEALAFTMTQQGSAHKMAVQVFWQGALVEDDTDDAGSSQPAISILATGTDYLRTVGLPTVNPGSLTTVWANGDLAVLDAPAGHETVHIGINFPLTLQGDGQWLNGDLWYHVQWQAPKTSGQGWVPASATTYTNPGGQTAWASFDVLSPDLASYLSNLQPHIAAVAYDLTRGRYYTFNMNGQFITGSSIKVFIMSAFYNMIEHQGREPNSTEFGLLTIMIENSDNNAASALYDEIGRAAGMTRFLRGIGIADMHPDNVSWGYSLITPLAMVHLLTMLHDGKLLNDAHRKQAFYWMENIELDQRNGACLTAPAGATCAMKDGWLPGPDGFWAANSSGIITVGQETYIMSVYTNGQNALGDNWNILNHVYGVIASILP